MIQKRDDATDTERATLTPQEQMVLDKLRQLAAEGKEEVDADFIALADQYLKWSYDDPESLARAAAFMAQDPFQHREVRAINAELAAPETDGEEP